MVPVIIGVTLIVFLTMRVLPGDPVQFLLRDQGATLEQVEELRIQLGLSDSLAKQYVRFLGELSRGDLGQSFTTRRPVLAAILTRIPATVELALGALFLGVVIGLFAGTVAAMNAGKPIDYLATSVSTIGLSLPSFWIGLMLIMLFAAQLQVLPSFGRFDDSITLLHITGLNLVDSLITGNWRALGASVRHLVLPSAALGVVLATYISRLVRNSMVEALAQDYTRTATAKGVGRWGVALRHGLRNVLLPVVTLVGVQLGNLLSGAIVVETVFAWPGLGRLVVDGIYQRDFPVVQGAVLMFTGMRLVLNLMTDLLYAKIDPRIAYG